MIFAAGSNAFGQLSNDTTIDISEFQQVSKSTPTKIASGSNHTLHVINRKVYGCGSNIHGQLGLESESYPQFVEIMEGDDVFCGWDCSFVLCAEQIYAAGDGKYGQLGIPSTKSWSLLPIEKVDKIACGLRHTLFKVGELVYGCGDNKYGCLGNQSTTVCDILKLEIEGVLDIAAGQFHSVVQTTRGIYVAGRNNHGQLCNSLPYSRSWIKIDLPLDQVPKSIASGWSTIAVVCENAIILWGRSDKGQCTNLDKKSGIKILNLKCTELQFGSEHAVCYSDDGLYVWGWNEHGNLGLGHLTNVIDPVMIPFPGRVVAIGIGAGHSIISIMDSD